MNRKNNKKTSDQPSFLKKAAGGFKKFRKTRVYSLCRVLLFICVCVGIGMGAAYIHHESDPTETAVQYFRAFMQQDYKTAKTLLDTTEGCYVNLSRLADILSKQKEKLDVQHYEIKEPKKEDGKWLVIFKCKSDETKKTTDFKVYLNKHYEGISLIPVFKVNINDLITKDYQVTIPEDDRLKINGEKVNPDEVRVNQNNDGTKTYIFPQILKGKYVVSCENSYGAFGKKININNANIKTNYAKAKYKANEKYQKEIDEKIESILQQYYSAVRKKQPKFDALTDLFPKDLSKTVQKSVKKSMNDIFDKEKDGDYELTEIDISNQKCDSTYNKENNTFEIEYSYQFNYTCQTKISLINSYTESYSGKFRSAMKLTFKIEGDKLEIKDFTVSNK